MKQIRLIVLTASGLMAGVAVEGQPAWLPSDAPLRYDPVTKTYSIRMQVGADGKKRSYRIEFPDAVSQTDLHVQSQVRVQDRNLEYQYRLSLASSSRWPVGSLSLGCVKAVMVRRAGDEVAFDLSDAAIQGRNLIDGVWSGREHVGNAVGHWKFTINRIGNAPAGLVLSSFGGDPLRPGGEPVDARLTSPALPALMLGWARVQTPTVEFPEFPDDETNKWYTLWARNNVLRFPVITPGIPRPEPYVRSKVVEAITADVRLWGARKFPEWSDRKLPEAVRAVEIAGLIEAAGRAEGAALEAALADLVNRTEAMPELSVNAKHLMRVYAQIIRRAPEK